MFEDFDKLSYDFYHKVGLDKEFLSNLRYELLVLIRKMFCPATHAFSSLPDERKKESGYVYVIENEHGNVKIGKSISPLNRVRQIETIGGYKIIRKWVSQKTVFFSKIETAAHRLFYKNRNNGEWFDVDFDDAIKIVSSLSDTSTN